MIHPLGRSVYRLLLRLLVPEFRAKHGAEMEVLFFEAPPSRRRRLA